MDCTRRLDRLSCPTAVVFQGATSYNDLSDRPTINGQTLEGEVSGMVAAARDAPGSSLTDGELDDILDGEAGSQGDQQGSLSDDDVDDIVNGGSGGDGPEGVLTDEELDDILGI